MIWATGPAIFMVTAPLLLKNASDKRVLPRSKRCFQWLCAIVSFPCLFSSRSLARCLPDDSGGKPTFPELNLTPIPVRAIDQKPDVAVKLLSFKKYQLGQNVFTLSSQQLKSLMIDMFFPLGVRRAYGGVAGQ